MRSSRTNPDSDHDALSDAPAAIRAMPRRAFLGGLAAATVAATAAPERLVAAVPATQGDADAWLKKITGEHRQFFDATAVEGGAALTYAMAWLNTMGATYKLTDQKLTAVVGMRHLAIPMAFTDAIWAKYKLGEVVGVNDPATNKPATRNIFFHPKAGDMMFAEASIDTLLPRGVVITVCSLATQVLSGMRAEVAGVSKEAALAEWKAGVIPGANFVPSGVLAVNRAQSVAHCTYCAAM